MKTSNFSLDTSSFASSANTTKKLATDLENAIEKCDNAINGLYGVWVGKGRNEFEKKYHIFETQVKDIKVGLWELYEDIVAAEEAYIQADLELAQSLSGVSEDYK